MLINMDPVSVEVGDTSVTNIGHTQQTMGRITRAVEHMSTPSLSSLQYSCMAMHLDGSRT